MALTSTIGTFYLPFYDRPDAQTPTSVEALQTTVNGATQGYYLIASSATASGDTYLISLNLSVEDITSTAQIEVIFDEVTIGCLPAAGATTPASGIGQANWYFGEIGLMGGTTTTNTVYLNIKNATASVVCTCRFNRKV